MKTRTQEVIRFIWARSRVTSLDIRRVIGLGSSSVHRILRGLEMQGYLQEMGRAPRQAMSGATTYPIVFRVTDRDAFYRDLVLPAAPSPRPGDTPPKETGRDKVLNWVQSTAQEFTASRLADIGGISRSYAAQLIKELEADGAITRIADHAQFGADYYIRARKERA